MIGYLDELYRIYLELDEEEDITLDFEPQPKTVKSEFGEVCLSPIGLFLVTATSGRYVTGFKVSPWIDFAINTDFIFSFDNKKWVAITEHELWIPEDQLSHIGMIDSVDLEIFYNYYANKKPIPSSHSGLTIPDDPGYPQNKFREREMAKCLEFIMSQFQALEELEESDVIEENTAIESKKVIDILTFKKIFSEKIITAELPMAAASSSKVA
ncbi:MAG: hypothetical protein LDL10_05950, partial [Calditerrivibrio sp.]|nr:hypothetical protein [Calditerrivibrio sp.]